MAYRDWEPDEKVSSPASAREKFSVRNRSGGRGKYSLKIGRGGTEQHTITNGTTDVHPCADQAVVGVNKGDVNLEWQRS